jgi:hypothetical protein
MSTIIRRSNPCDGCTLRRVRCDETRPCSQCQVRGLQCTSLQVRKKRGPKGGPRRATKAKVESFQKTMQATLSQNPPPDTQSINGQQQIHDEPGKSNYGRSPEFGFTSRTRVGTPEPSLLPYEVSLDDYRRFIGVFKQKASLIWPVINSEDLLFKLDRPDLDWETLALAAALCAATVAQLRLPEHNQSLSSISSRLFVAECLRFRTLYNYYETHSIASILIPFFLHIYYANLEQRPTAGFFLRESITYIHIMRLDRPETFSHLGSSERSHRLRVYWLLFISERCSVKTTTDP